MLSREVSRKFIIAPGGKHKLHFILPANDLQILPLESIHFSGIRTLHIHNLNDLLRQTPNKTLTARFDHHCISDGQQFLRHLVDFLLQERLAASQLHKRNSCLSSIRTCASPREFVHARQHFVDAHLFAAMKSVSGIAPGTPQIAARQPHKHTRQTCARAFSLNRFENFRNEHELFSGPSNPLAVIPVSLFYFPGLYCALAVSVSHTTMSLTRAPAGNSLTFPVTWS